MRRCSGIKPNGEQCTLTVEPPETYCWHHTPKRAEQRRRAASRGGSSHPSREVRTIKEEIKEAIGRLEREELDRNIARAMFSGYSVLLDYIKLERGVHLEEDLAARLEALKNSERPNAS
jgi:hypothetical protein